MQGEEILRVRLNSSLLERKKCKPLGFVGGMDESLDEGLW